MNKVEFRTPASPPTDLGEPRLSQAAGRGPPKAVKCLLPVWGYQFIRQFLDVGLPTWIAPGNLPALAAALPCEFVILTSREDEQFLRLHPAFKRLCEVCRTTVHHIDHLITGTNYSTTVTLAYSEAIRATGPDVVDTCFFFLVSDYIVADGSFRYVLERMQEGRSGVLVGNFQVVHDEAMPWLREQLNRSPAVLSLKPREIMRWALSHLHPATVANIVNYPLSHNDHTNRLFWRVDGQTLIGRFFLMHMICIRPELADFVIGASCDYSFVPEMCPSGNVEIVTDSDNYLVTEMQTREHEDSFLRPGPLRPARLAETLSEWTTARHRQNSDTTVIFHSSDVPVGLNRTIAMADDFLKRVRERLSKKPKPHRRHPYWQGALAAFREAIGAKLDDEEWRLSLGLANPALDRGWLSDWIFEKVRFAFFGKPPNVRRWHPRWPDHSLVLDNLHGFFAHQHQRLLLVSAAPTVFTASLADSGERVVRFRTGHFLSQPPEIHEPLLNAFDVCLIEISENEMNHVDDLFDRIAPLIKAGGKIIISLYSQRSLADARGFSKSIGFHATRLVRPAAGATEFYFIGAHPIRWRIFRTMMSIAKMTREAPVIGVPVLVVCCAPLALACYVANAGATTISSTPPRGIISSVVIVINVDEASAREAHKYSASRIIRHRQRLRLGLAEGGGLPPFPAVGKAHDVGPLLGQAPATAEPNNPKRTSNVSTNSTTKTDAMASEATREPQYNRCLELKDEFGLTPLGLMTNQVWHDDPRRLGFLLARYKFVSKMLSGKKYVGELGCGDAFGTRIVLQEVDTVVAYDFDPVFIDDIRKRRSERWPIEGHQHDIIVEPLPNRHDGIYSLDVIEHIPSLDEHAYVAHLRESLTDDGVLIIGTPSLESQAYASPPSKAGHVNCKSGPELKALLQVYFKNVFLFSMNDEVVHTGFYPMAHYLFAICCGKT